MSKPTTMPLSALNHATDHLPTFLGGNHDVQPAPSLPTPNANDHANLPTFLGGDHEVAMVGQTHGHVPDFVTGLS